MTLCSDIQWTVGGPIGDAQVETVIPAQRGSLLPLGKAKVWSSGLGMQGRWLSLASVLSLILKSNGIWIRSWGLGAKPNPRI